jgi:hypothetical protein
MTSERSAAEFVTVLESRIYSRRVTKWRRCSILFLETIQFTAIHCTRVSAYAEEGVSLQRGIFCFCEIILCFTADENKNARKSSLMTNSLAGFVHAQSRTTVLCSDWTGHLGDRQEEEGEEVF